MILRDKRLLISLHSQCDIDRSGCLNMLYIATTLLILMGILHSYLGERYLLMRLFKRSELPKLLGDATFTKNTLRFVWHLSTIAWWGLAYLIFLSTGNILTTAQVLHVIGALSIISGLLPLWFTRGKHLSWIVFSLVGILLFIAANK